MTPSLSHLQDWESLHRAKFETATKLRSIPKHLQLIAELYLFNILTLLLHEHRVNQTAPRLESLEYKSLSTVRITQLRDGSGMSAFEPLFWGQNCKLPAYDQGVTNIVYDWACRYVKKRYECRGCTATHMLCPFTR